MPTTKITGPHQLAAILETTWAGAAQALSLSSGWLRALKTDIGDGVLERTLPDLTHVGRGQFHEVVGRRLTVPFTVELPFQGSGTDATDLAGRKALVKAAGLTVAESGTVAYTLTANPAAGAMLYRVDRQALLGEYLVGCIVTQMKIEMNKSDIPKITLTGEAVAKHEFCATTLGAAITTTDGTSITLADAYAIRTGQSADAVSGLGIYIKIDTEILKVTAFTRSTGVATVVRGQLGSSGATHLIAVAVTPLATGITYEDAAADLIPGPNTWSVAISSLASDSIRSLSIDIDTGRAFDELTSGSDIPQGVHNKALRVTGSLTYIHSTAKQMIGQLLDQNTSLDIDVTLTSPGGDVWTIAMGNVKLDGPVPKNPEPNEVAECTVSFRALDTAIDTLDAISIGINVP